MQLAVTGATGFLGRYLVHYLTGQHHRLRCWYRPQSDRSGFEDVASAVVWKQGQLGDEQACHELVQGVDAVIHSALHWKGGSFRATDDDLKFLEANIMGTLQLMRAAKHADVDRFIFISSCSVHEVILGDRPLDERHPLWPTSFYGAHKAALEKFVHAYGMGMGWPICALRPTGIYGIAHPVRESKWYRLVGEVLRGEPISSAKGGKEVHALDVAKAVDLLLHADPRAIAGQAFNCYDRYISDQDVAKLAKEISGSKSKIEEINKGPKHQIVTDKLRELGMTYGGDAALKHTVAELVKAQAR